MNRISINGIDIVSGGNISIVGGVVTVDGVVQTGAYGGGAMELRILEGTIENLTTDRSVSCLNVTGNVKAGGSVNCDAIGGAVSAGGSVNCDDIKGSVTAGGSVNCDDIGGSVTASVVKRS